MMEAIRALASGLANQVTRAKLKLSAYDKQKRRTLLQLNGMADEIFQNVELLLPYGMSALPVGTTGDVLLLQVLADRNHLVGLHADDPALRIKDLEAGEYGFRDQNGQQVVFRKDHVEITTPLKGTAIKLSDGNGNALSFGSSGVTINGAVISLSGDVTTKHGTSLDQHVNTGVTKGSDNSGPPP